ncbi:MAG: hypothetical protein K2P07_07100 [Lachnospiraceae bacterium]|nr:hypothetical protein [Lachnospiraceae bacterium]
MYKLSLLPTCACEKSSLSFRVTNSFNRHTSAPSNSGCTGRTLRCVTHAAEYLKKNGNHNIHRDYTLLELKNDHRLSDIRGFFRYLLKKKAITQNEYEEIREISDVNDDRIVDFTWLQADEAACILKVAQG